jgi:hypothetical protein
VTALTIDLDVVRGTAFAAVLPGHTMSAAHTSDRYPIFGRIFPPGRYTLVMARPAPGPWTIDVGNVSAGWQQTKPALVSTVPLDYAVTVRLFASRVKAVQAGADAVEVAIENRGAALREPVIEASEGRLESSQRTFLPDGRPSVAEIDVPPEATALHVRARSSDPDASAIELHLYECTTGECFSHDFTLPAAVATAITVRRPRAGRWVAAINPAPFPAARGGFVLETVVAKKVVSRVSLDDVVRATEAKPISVPFARRALSSDVNALVIELVDRAVQRDEDVNRWETRANMPDFRQRPAAIGTAILPLRQKN